MEFFDFLASVFTLYNFGFMTLGVIAGIVGGALPGISPSMTIALILPMSLYLTPSGSIMMLLGAYQGAMYGGSISAILINTPGTASAAATAIDGYQMALKGQAGKAIGMSLSSSVLGGLISAVFLMFLAKWLAIASLKFGPAEYFGIMLLALTLIAGVAADNILKGLAASGLGLLVATVGQDPVQGTERLTFGIFDLSDGFSLLSVFIGVFAFSELLSQLRNSRENLNAPVELLSMKNDRLTLAEFMKEKWNMLYSSVIGTAIGILPGVGGTTASFLAYAEAKRRSKHPEEYGKGSIESVAAVESANNAVCGGALIPMLSLGIPGDVVTAIMMGAFVAQGIKPGPMLFTQNIDSVYMIYAGMVASNIVLLIVGFLSISTIVKIVQIRKSLLFPSVFILCIVGTYAERGNTFDCMMMLGFGLLGYFLKSYKFQLAPFVIAFVLGPEAELNFRLALRISDNNYMTFLEKPISACLLLTAVVSGGFFLYRAVKLSRAAAAATIDGGNAAKAA